MKLNLQKRSDLKEVEPMDIGAFYLTDKMGTKLSDFTVQRIFNQPMWKRHYISPTGEFFSLDIRDGKVTECKIVQVAN